MSVADRLGKPQNFGGRRNRSERGQAKAIAEGNIPTYELIRLDLDGVAPTPLNPRRNFGTDDDLTRFGEELRHAQLAACVAVTRGAYLALWPEHETELGPTIDHVLINGERRYRSALHVGLEKLDFVLRDELASTREDFVNYLLKENLEREDFDLIERARGVKALVDICTEENATGARTRAAERLGKSKAWVGNQLDLLILPTELQEKLSTGDLPERDGRAMARKLKKQPDLDAATLLASLAEAKQEEADAKQRQKDLLQAAEQQAVLTAVNTEGQQQEQPKDAAHAWDRESDGVAGETKTLTAVNTKPAVEPATEPMPLPRQKEVAEDPTASESSTDAESDEIAGPRVLRFDEPGYISNLIRRRMETPHFFTLLRHMLDQAGERDAEQLRAVLEELHARQ
ncbi:ParB/RepB/Spo0J family partition protein [Streptomyces sp. NPDC127172]|uniref:ParB/RepB/Spo0J family partition protein n=1 Tax=Streptomyces sp. NPDC127172 TaxID=3345382 RepID=UPI00363E146A